MSIFKVLIHQRRYPSLEGRKSAFIIGINVLNILINSLMHTLKVIKMIKVFIGSRGVAA